MRIVSLFKIVFACSLANIGLSSIESRSISDQQPIEDPNTEPTQTIQNVDTTTWTTPYYTSSVSSETTGMMTESVVVLNVTSTETTYYTTPMSTETLVVQNTVIPTYTYTYTVTDTLTFDSQSTNVPVCENVVETTRMTVVKTVYISECIYEDVNSTNVLNSANTVQVFDLSTTDSVDSKNYPTPC